MSIRVLENEYLRATISDDGAELTSVWDKTAGQERIWTGDPAIWNRHSPILFPFVGKVVNGQYRYGGRTYAMKTQHGFARDMPFECVEAGDHSITHRLTATEATRAIYPFEFRLTVTHQLMGRQLQVKWRIENAGDAPMIFSIGGHPGFLPPEGVRKEDCFITFPQMSSLHYISADRAGFALPGTKALPLEDGFARYQDDIPATWIFEDAQVKTVGIATPDRKPYVTLSCPEFPMLAVWANPNGPFICLEPWFGRTDDAGFTGSLEEKKAVVQLKAGAHREISYSMAFHG